MAGSGRRERVGEWSRALSDANGHYRLIGLPNGKGNQLLLSPGDDQPYLKRQVEVPASPGFEPIKFDIALHRGLWITGRATNKVTGHPVAARLYYLPFRDNPFSCAVYPEFRSRSVDGEDRPKATWEDGTFRIVGLPGRAIVGGWTASAERYRRGVGATEIQGIHKNGLVRPTASFQAGTNGRTCSKRTKPHEGVEEIHCDLVFDPGETVHVSLIDRNGKPVNGSNVIGCETGGDAGSKPSTFAIVNWSPGENGPTDLNDHLNIGKLLFDPTEKTPKSPTITPSCAPRSSAGWLAQTASESKEVWSECLARLVTFGRSFRRLRASTGKFKVAVPPGCPYGLRADVRGFGPTLQVMSR